MARLPIPGSDDGTWGDILNSYLLQSLTADGSIRTGVVGSPQLADTAVTSAKLAPSAVTSSHLSTGSVTNSAITDGAIAQSKIANLSGDLASKANTTHTHSIADTTNLQTVLDSKAGSVHTHTASQLSDASTAGRTLITAADATAQRTALGLGSAATLTVGTTAGTVAAGDDSRLTGALQASGLDAATAGLVGDEGSATMSSLTSTFAPRPASIVTLGDSRMARDGSVTTAIAGETAVYRRSDGILSTALIMARQRARFLANGGVGGDTVAQMRARVDALLDTYRPGYMVGFGHVNSIATQTAAQIIADLGYIFDAASRRGVVTIWGTDWCQSTHTTGQRTVSYTVNEWLRSLVGVRQGFHLVDYQARFVNSDTGNPVSGYANDGLHQDPPGIVALATPLADALTTLLPRSDRLIASNDDPLNLCANGMLTGSSGGGYATGWGYNGTGAQGAQSKVTRTDGFPGDWQQIAYTAATDYQLRRRIASGTSGSWVAGQTVYGEVEFETDAASWSVTELSLNVNLFGLPGGTVIRAADGLRVNTAVGNLPRITSGILRTPPILIPVGTTTVDLAMVVKGTGTVRWARAALKAA